MKHADKLALGFITIAVTLLGMRTSVFASNGLRTVALSGQPAPGTSAGVTFGNFLFPPSLNDSGHTAFQSMLTGSGVVTTNDTGAWTEGGSGQLRLMAREGNPAPGIALNFADFSNNINAPVINDDGYTVFGNRQGRGPDLGIWVEGGGVLSLRVRPGEQAPGVPAGINFNSFSTVGATGGVPFNNLNDIGFSASLTGGGVTFENDSGVWSGGGSGALLLRAREGDPAPGTSVTFGNLANVGGPTLNDSGRIMFRGSLFGVGVDSSNNVGLWSDRNGTLELIARAGDQAPGTPLGVRFTGASNPIVMNDAGHVAFGANLTGSGVGTSNNVGIWADRGAGVQLVARSGDPAPGMPAGVNFLSPFGPPVLNTNGEMVFMAALAGPNLGSNNAGIWSDVGGEGLKLIVREGQQAPGAPAGVIFESIQSFNAPTLNARGQIAFRAQLSGPGVTIPNDSGLWAQDIHGQLHLIVREGDTLDVSDDPLNPDLRTVSGFSFENRSGNEDGVRSGFNEFGQVAFWAAFTNGTQGLFVSGLVAVPEPGVCALVAVFAAILVSQRKWIR